MARLQLPRALLAPHLRQALFSMQSTLNPSVIAIVLGPCGCIYVLLDSWRLHSSLQTVDQKPNKTFALAPWPVPVGLPSNKTGLPRKPFTFSGLLHSPIACACLVFSPT